MVDDTIGGLARIGRQAMLALAWVLTLIALVLATWATIAPARAQPAWSNQNVSGR